MSWIEREGETNNIRFFFAHIKRHEAPQAGLKGKQICVGEAIKIGVSLGFLVATSPVVVF